MFGTRIRSEIQGEKEQGQSRPPSRGNDTQGEFTLLRTGRTASRRTASQSLSSRKGSPQRPPQESFHSGASAQDASISCEKDWDFLSKRRRPRPHRIGGTGSRQRPVRSSLGGRCNSPGVVRPPPQVTDRGTRSLRWMVCLPRRPDVPVRSARKRMGFSSCPIILEQV